MIANKLVSKVTKTPNKVVSKVKVARTPMKPQVVKKVKLQTSAPLKVNGRRPRTRVARSGMQMLQKAMSKPK